MNLTTKNLSILIICLLSSGWLLPSARASGWSWIQTDAQNPNSWALQFNGTAYVTFGPVPKFQNQQILTIEACIKLAKDVKPLSNKTWQMTGITILAYMGLLSRGRSGWGFGFDCVTGRLSFGIGENGGSWIGFASTTNNWANGTTYWLTLVFDPTASFQNVRFYVNGTLDASYDTKQQIQYNNDETLYFGNTFYDDIDTVPYYRDHYFSGIAGEVRIWNESRTQAQVQDVMNRNLNSTEVADSSLIEYCKFNEGAGSTAHDSSIYHQDGTIVNAVWVTIPEFPSALVLSLLTIVTLVAVVLRTRFLTKKEKTLDP